MPKRLTTEDQLARLRPLRTAERSDTAIGSLAEILNSRLHGMVLKMAAELAEKWEAKSLAPALVAAAESLAPSPDNIKRDPGCEGKQAALHALVSWDAAVPAFYSAAARWIQREPVQKGTIDTAAECRGLAAIGIAQTRLNDPDALMLLIDLLADEEATTRLRAAQALSMWRGTEAVPLLRLKAHTGDESAEVLGEVLIGLLRNDPRGQLDFVARFLDEEDPNIVEAAALALGESHQPAALEPLAAAYHRLAREPVSTTILMSLALLRTDDSLAWFLTQLEKAKERTTKELLHALRIYKGDTRTVKKIEQVLKEKGDDYDQALKETFRE